MTFTAMSHADRFEAYGLELSNLAEGQCFAFAVCVRVTIRLISCKHESSVWFPVHAWTLTQ